MILLWEQQKVRDDTKQVYGLRICFSHNRESRHFWDHSDEAFLEMLESLRHFTEFEAFHWNDWKLEVLVSLSTWQSVKLGNTSSDENSVLCLGRIKDSARWNHHLVQQLITQQAECQWLLFDHEPLSKILGWNYYYYHYFNSMPKETILKSSVTSKAHKEEQGTIWRLSSISSTLTVDSSPEDRQPRPLGQTKLTTPREF